MPSATFRLFVIVFPHVLPSPVDGPGLPPWSPAAVVLTRRLHPMMTCSRRKNGAGGLQSRCVWTIGRIRAPIGGEQAGDSASAWRLTDGHPPLDDCAPR